MIILFARGKPQIEVFFVNYIVYEFKYFEFKIHGPIFFAVTVLKKSPYKPIILES